ncbi:MAG: BCD family MFS transporter [bacterium]
MSRITLAPSVLIRGWTQLGARYLPFADAATVELPLRRLCRLGLFQVSVAMATTLLAGTLNRVMIVELNVPASLVALMVSLPLLVAPFRALIGYRSDVHRSVLGWRRVPFLWFGSMLQFGGLAIMPFALILLSGDTNGSVASARTIAALAFILVGAGAHTTQTAGLALATDLAPERVRPRAVALLYVMLLIGMVGSALAFGQLLAPFSQLRLIKVIQGAAVVTMVFNMIALWKQEPRAPRVSTLPREADAPASLRAGVESSATGFRVAWQSLAKTGQTMRLLVSVGLGAAAFGMQDVLLEPYGGQILHLGVGATTALTALMAAGSLVAFALSARLLERGADPLRLASMGLVVGVFAFSAVIFAAPLESASLFRVGTTGIGFGSGLFGVGTLLTAMGLNAKADNGLALGAWGAVQATLGGVAVLSGGLIRDAVATLAARGALGEAMSAPFVSYSVVYHVEIALLFATLIAIGPLVKPLGAARAARQPQPFGLSDLPG